LHGQRVTGLILNHPLGEVEQKRKERLPKHQRGAIGRASSRSLAVIDADESLGQLLPIKELTESYKEMPWLHNLIKDIVSPKVHLRVW